MWSGRHPTSPTQSLRRVVNLEIVDRVLWVEYDGIFFECSADVADNEFVAQTEKIIMTCRAIQW